MLFNLPLHLAITITILQQGLVVQAPNKQNDGALQCHDVLTLKAVLNKKTVLRRLLKVSTEHVVVFSSDGGRFQARGAGGSD